MKTITKVFLFTMTCFMLAIVANGQTTSVLLCTEGQNMKAVKYFPSQKKSMRVRGGRNVEFLEWKAALGNDKGKYNLSVTSSSNFSINVWQKSRSRNSRGWERLTNYTPAVYIRARNGGRYYQYSRNFRVTSWYSEGYDILIRAYPRTRQGTFTASWYTTNCEKKRARRNNSKRSAQCKWIYYGGNSVYGLGGNYYCNCRGKRYDTKNIDNRNQQNIAERACGRIPGGSSKLFMPSIKNNFLDWKRESNLLVGKKVFHTES